MNPKNWLTSNAGVLGLEWGGTDSWILLVSSPAYQLAFSTGKVDQAELCFPRDTPPIVSVHLRGHTLLYLVGVCIRALF